MSSVEEAESLGGEDERTNPKEDQEKNYSEKINHFERSLRNQPNHRKCIKRIFGSDLFENR